MKDKKILVVATSRNTRGGITAVINAHAQGEQWGKYHIKWIEAHIDRNVFLKLIYFLTSLIQFVFLLPFYDLVHFHVSTFSSILRKSFYLIWAKIWRKKVITHLHCSTPSIIYSKRNVFFYRHFFLLSDVVLVLSTQWKKYVEDALSIKDNVRILYNPIVLQPSTNFELQRKKYILFAGTIDKRKGYHDLIYAFSKIVAIHSDWTLVLVGNGELDEGVTIAKKLDILSHVKFLGWVSGKEKDRVFREASIFCLPSYAEGFPMSVLDAWAYNLPVVATPIGGLLDVAIDGDNILLFNPGNIDSLVNQLTKLILDVGLRERIAMSSHKLATSLFELSNINRKLTSIYEELLNKL